jgi:hypothetical protein
LLDKPYFLRPSPSLDLLFPIDSVTNVLIALEPNESIALVYFCEAGNCGLSMFLNPAFDAIGHSAVENMGSAGNDVNEVVMISFAHLKTQWLSKREPQVPPLGYAPVGMTRGRVELPSAWVAGGGNRRSLH